MGSRFVWLVSLAHVLWGVPSEEAAPTCRDNDDRCGLWAEKGECINNPNYMLSECAVSCASCAAADDDAPAWTGGCFDRDAECGDWSLAGECDANPNWMRANCAASCGACVRPTTHALPGALEDCAARLAAAEAADTFAAGDAASALAKAAARTDARVLNVDPPIVEFPAFFTAAEADAIAARAEDATTGFERSMDAGSTILADGTFVRRRFFF